MYIDLRLVRDVHHRMDGGHRRKNKSLFDDTIHRTRRSMRSTDDAYPTGLAAGFRSGIILMPGLADEHFRI